MNFIEAVQHAKAGMPVKRSGWAEGVQLSIGHEPGYCDDKILVYHIAACPIPLTATDVLAQDWELMYYLPSWFEVGREVVHNNTGTVYKITKISLQEWTGCYRGNECMFSTIGIEKHWSPVECRRSLYT